MIAEFTRTNREHGGCIIFADNKFKYEPINLKHYSEEMEFECAGCSINADNIMIAIVCVYRPPSPNHNIFFNKLNNLMTNLYKSYSYVILCGDFNINYLMDTPAKKILKDIFTSFNLKNKLSEPTRVQILVNNLTSTQIDYIVSNIPENTWTCRNVNLNLSDHYAQLSNIELNCTNKEKSIPKTKQSREINTLDFNSNLSRINWQFIKTGNKPGCKLRTIYK